MSDEVPVMIHLPASTFMALEKIAERKGMPMRELIVAGLVRSVTVRHVSRTPTGHVPTSTKGGGEKRGYRRLNDTEWAELKRYRAAGWSVAELVDRYGCSSSSIWYRIRREQQ